MMLDSIGLTSLPALQLVDSNSAEEPKEMDELDMTERHFNVYYKTMVKYSMIDESQMPSLMLVSSEPCESKTARTAA